MAASLDVVGWFAYGLIALGMVLIGKKERLGWFVKALGDALWCAIGYHIGMSSILFPEAISTMVAIYFWWSWRKDGSEASEC